MSWRGGLIPRFVVSSVAPQDAVPIAADVPIRMDLKSFRLASLFGRGFDGSSRLNQSFSLKCRSLVSRQSPRMGLARLIQTKCLMCRHPPADRRERAPTLKPSIELPQVAAGGFDFVHPCPSPQVTKHAWLSSSGLPNQTVKPISGLASGALGIWHTSLPQHIKRVPHVRRDRHLCSFDRQNETGQGFWRLLPPDRAHSSP